MAEPACKWCDSPLEELWATQCPSCLMPVRHDDGHWPSWWGRAVSRPAPRPVRHLRLPAVPSPQQPELAAESPAGP